MLDLFEKLIEASASDIRRKQKSIKRLFPDFDAKTKGVEDKGGLKLVNQSANRWTFKIHSGTDDSLWYDAYLNFKEVKSTLERMVKDRRLWVSDKSRVDLRKLAKQFMDKVDIQLFCSCKAFQYWGPAHILSLDKYDAMAGGRKEVRPPKERNPKKYGMLCKHLDRLLKVLPFYSGTAARWINDFYAEDIKKWEQEARETFGWAKAVGKALGKRREEKPITPPPVEPEPKPELEVEPEVEPEVVPKEEPTREPKAAKISTEEPGIAKGPPREPGVSKKKVKEPGIAKSEPVEPGLAKEKPIEKPKEEPEEEEPEEEPKKTGKTPGGKKDKKKKPEWKPDAGEGPEEDYF